MHGVIMMGCGWYLDSGASFHMTGDKSLFSTLEEKYLKIHIDMGDNENFSVSGVGTVSFQREHAALITLIDVKYVPGLKKNLVLIRCWRTKAMMLSSIRERFSLDTSSRDR